MTNPQPADDRAERIAELRWQHHTEETDALSDEDISYLFDELEKADKAYGDCLTTWVDCRSLLSEERAKVDTLEAKIAQIRLLCEKESWVPKDGESPFVWVSDIRAILDSPLTAPEGEKTP